VTVKSGEKNWEVSISVIAQQDAFVGDIINLKHPKTNTVLVGKVTGQGEVELR
jgi:flagella basal body P-ring formation protein FlgA